MLNYYRRFIEGASQAFEVIQHAIDTGEFPLHTEAASAIEGLRERIASPPVLKLPDPAKKKMLVTDASGRWVGGALMQLEDDGEFHPCAFRSQRLHDEQTRYKIVELEAWAVVAAMIEWRPWLLGQPFDVVTDHRALTCLTSGKHDPPSPRLIRWTETIAPFSFSIIWRPGSDEIMSAADLLSRPSGDGERETTIAEVVARAALSNRRVAESHAGYSPDELEEGDATTVWTHCVWVESLLAKKQQRRTRAGVVMAGRDEMDELVLRAHLNRDISERLKFLLRSQAIKEDIISKETPAAAVVSETPAGDAWEPASDLWGELKSEYMRDDSLDAMLEEGTLKQNRGDGLVWTTDNRVYVPPGRLRNLLVRTAHDAATAAHRSLPATLRRLSKFWWPGQTAAVKKKVSECLICAKVKGFTAKPAGAAGRIDIPALPFEHIHVDFSGAISDGRRLAVVVDRLTSFTVAWPSPVNLTSAGLARELVEKVFSIFGLPLKVTSDNDVLLSSILWRTLMQKAGIRHLTTVVNRPQANGKVERRMRIVKEALAASLRPEKDWMEALPLVLLAINTATSAEMELSPAHALLG